MCFKRSSSFQQKCFAFLIFGIVAAVVVIGALGRESPEPQTYIGKSGKPVVSQEQFTGGTRDGWGDRLTRDMKQINMPEVYDDIPQWPVDVAAYADTDGPTTCWRTSIPG